MIVPQGFLWRVPFETLGGADGTRLAGGATITYAGSLTLHARNRSIAVNEAAPPLTCISAVAAASPFYSTISIEDRPILELRTLFTTPIGAARVRIDEPPTPEPQRPIDDAMHAVQWAFTAAGVQSVTVGRVTLGARTPTN